MVSPDSRDEGHVQLIEAMLVGTIVAVTIPVAYDMARQPEATATDVGQGPIHETIEDVVLTGDAWCCPPDPSSPSILQDAMFQAWAGRTEPMEDGFGQWFANPLATDFTTSVSWKPHGVPATEQMVLYASDDPDTPGKKAGVQYPAKPARWGPAFVVPSLDTLAPNSSANVHFVPIEQSWPYRIGPQGAHKDAIRTEITYTRTALNEDDTELTLTQTGHSELTGPKHPAINVSFAEPDWTKRAAESDQDIGIKFEDRARTFTQTLTKDDLAKERTQRNESLPEGIYPHHPFLVHVRSPSLDASSKELNDESEEASRLKISIRLPRNWIDVEFTRSDRKANNDTSWNNTRVTHLPTGAWRITAVLDEPLNYTLGTDASGQRVVASVDELDAPFAFHARPPSEQAQAELGFQTIRATASALHAPIRGQGSLTVELASQPGRVHRTLDVTAPRIVPPGPLGENASQPAGTRVPIGAVLRNGGEATNVQRIEWTAPPGTFVANRTYTLEDFSGTSTGTSADGGVSGTNHEVAETGDRLEDGAAGASGLAEKTTGLDTSTQTTSTTSLATGTVTGTVNSTKKGTWRVENTAEHSKLIWESASDQGATCAKLSACSVAASVLVDGRNLTSEPLWPRPQTASVYGPGDVQPYVDWFVRSDKAWSGVPLGNDERPGFARTYHKIGALPGPSEGTRTFHLPPTLTPVCTGSDIERRDRAYRSVEGDRVVYDLGPRENGLGHVAGNGCQAGKAESDPRSSARGLDEHTFSLIGRSGGRWDLAAVGQHAYTSDDEINAQTFAQWQNGVAESHVTGPDTVRAGESANFTLHLASLFDALLYQDVGEVTITGNLVDPYNTWTGPAWKSKTIVESKQMAQPGSEDATPTLDVCLGNAGPASSCSHTGDPNTGPEVEGQRYEKVPSDVLVTMQVPEGTVPGTHVFVGEIQWEYKTADTDQAKVGLVGAGKDTQQTITQTGRVIAPVDVLTPDGFRARPALIGATAWADDWEKSR